MIATSHVDSATHAGDDAISVAEVDLSVAQIVGDGTAILEPDDGDDTTTEPYAGDDARSVAEVDLSVAQLVGDGTAIIEPEDGDGTAIIEQATEPIDGDKGEGKGKRKRNASASDGDKGDGKGNASSSAGDKGDDKGKRSKSSSSDGDKGKGKSKRNASASDGDKGEGKGKRKRNAPASVVAQLVGNGKRFKASSSAGDDTMQVVAMDNAGNASSVGDKLQVVAMKAPPEDFIRVGTSDLSSVDFEQSSEVFCNWCKSVCRIDQVRVTAKSSSRFKCNRCNSTSAKCNATLGKWPTKEFLSFSEAVLTDMLEKGKQA